MGEKSYFRYTLKVFIIIASIAVFSSCSSTEDEACSGVDPLCNRTAKVSLKIQDGIDFDGSQFVVTQGDRVEFDGFDSISDKLQWKMKNLSDGSESGVSDCGSSAFCSITFNTPGDFLVILTATVNATDGMSMGLAGNPESKKTATIQVHVNEKPPEDVVREIEEEEEEEEEVLEIKRLGAALGSFKSNDTLSILIVSKDQNGDFISVSKSDVTAQLLTVDGEAPESSAATVLSVSSEQAAESVSATLLIDDSYSMSWNDPPVDAEGNSSQDISLAQRYVAAKSFVDLFKGTFEISVRQFHKPTQTETTPVGLVSDFTSDKTAIKTAIDTHAAHGSTTPLFAKAKDALTALAARSSDRKIFVILADGEANNGDYNNYGADAITAAQDGNIEVYAVGLGNSIGNNFINFPQNVGGKSIYLPIADKSLLETNFKAIGDIAATGAVNINISLAETISSGDVVVLRLTIKGINKDVTVVK